jgi:hypothetical protein
MDRDQVPDLDDVLLGEIAPLKAERFWHIRKVTKSVVGSPAESSDG